MIKLHKGQMVYLYTLTQGIISIAICVSIIDAEKTIEFNNHEYRSDAGFNYTRYIHYFYDPKPTWDGLKIHHIIWSDKTPWKVRGKIILPILKRKISNWLNSHILMK